MALATDIAGFSRLITALDPWLERMVIVGGLGPPVVPPASRRAEARLRATDDP